MGRRLAGVACWVGSALLPSEAHASVTSPARPRPTVTGPATPAAPAPEAPSPAGTQHRQQITLGLAGMATLTGWAVGNIAVGVAGNLTTTGTARFFHQGNAAWNTVNLALGISGLVSRSRERPASLATGRVRAHRAQQVFGINAGLDVLYIGTGAILWPLGRDLDHPRVHGYGQALVLQGAFLLVFDVAMMVGHEVLLRRWSGPNAPRLRPSALRLRPVAPRLRPAVVPGPAGGLTPGLVLRLHPGLRRRPASVPARREIPRPRGRQPGWQRDAEPSAPDVRRPRDVDRAPGRRPSGG